jgi:hypothetical protein
MLSVAFGAAVLIVTYSHVTPTMLRDAVSAMDHEARAALIRARTHVRRVLSVGIKVGIKSGPGEAVEGARSPSSLAQSGGL